jgi:hypothetical protein
MTEQEPEDPQKGKHSKRRLSDTILVAFHFACDQGDIEIAWELLNALEFMTMRQPKLPAGRERRVKEALVAAHERLWQMRRRVPPTF